MLKNDLASLKSEVHELDVDKLETTPVDVSKLGDVVKKKLLKKQNIINWLKMLMLLRLILVTWLKRLIMTQKLK